MELLKCYTAFWSYRALISTLPRHPEIMGKRNQLNLQVSDARDQMKRPPKCKISLQYKCQWCCLGMFLFFTNTISTQLHLSLSWGPWSSAAFLQPSAASPLKATPVYMTSVCDVILRPLEAGRLAVDLAAAGLQRGGCAARRAAPGTRPCSTHTQSSNTERRRKLTNSNNLIQTKLGFFWPLSLFVIDSLDRFMSCFSVLQPVMKYYCDNTDWGMYIWC